MKVTNKMLAVLAGVALALSFSAIASDKDDAVKMVGDAVSYVQSAGKDKAVADINAGKFVKGELYVFVYDMNAVMVAHPMNAKLIGKNLMDTPDAEGKMFRKEIIETVKAKGSGWTEYVYKSPGSGKIENKVTFCKKASDLVLCTGIYK